MNPIGVLVFVLCSTFFHQVASQGPRGAGGACTRSRYHLDEGCGKGLICGDDDKCVQAETCREKYEEYLENRGKIQDLEPPSCDADGNFNLIQCYAMWTGNGHCGCVDKYTGGRMSVGLSGRSDEAKKMTCQCAQDKADRFYRFGNMPGVSFNCHDVTGDYKPAKCVGSVCRCVTRSGDLIPGYGDIPIGTSDCQCARDKDDGGLPFQCKSDGSHYKKQCFGNICFCVRRLEQVLASSGSGHPPAPNVDQC